MEDLKTDVEAHLRKLRAADSQATAIAWMKGAYTLLEKCIRELDERPTRHVAHERLVFVPERPKLTVVQSLPASPMTPAYSKPPVWFAGNTVVYPDRPLPFKSEPKAWTHKDTLRLERAAKLGQPVIQRRGR